MKILFFGDVVGRVGRSGVKQAISKAKAEHQPDIIIANAENLAHGIGITPKIIEEMQSYGVNLFTSGNHVWDKPVGEEVLQAKNPVVLRPANYGNRKSGQGYKVVELGGQKLLVINLQCQVWMKDEVDSPFTTLDEILAQHDLKSLDAIFVDLHGEATSEKVAMGHYGQARISPGGYAYACPNCGWAHFRQHGLPDGRGMTGARDSVIGVQKKTSSNVSRRGGKRFEYTEESL